MTENHNTESLFIDRKMILIRPLHSSESFAKKNYIELLELYDYVAIGVFQKPSRESLDTYCKLKDNDSMVYVAVSEEDNSLPPLGVALYIRNETTNSHEFSILVKRNYLHTRLGLELTSMLATDAANHEVKALFTSDSSEDKFMYNIAKKLNMSERLIPHKTRQVRYSLQVDKHPDIVKFG